MRRGSHFRRESDSGFGEEEGVSEVRLRLMTWWL